MSNQKIITASQMQLGDTVYRNEGRFLAFDAYIVINKTVSYVTLFRPYATCSDFSVAFTRAPHTQYEEKGECVIPYMGSEEVTLGSEDSSEWVLYARRDIK